MYFNRNTGMWFVLSPDAQYFMISLAQIFGTGLGMCLIFLPKLLNLDNDIKKVGSTTSNSTTRNTTSGSRTYKRRTSVSGVQEMDQYTTEFDQLREEIKKLKGQLKSHQEIDIAAANTSHHTITALPRNDDDNNASSRQTSSFFSHARDETKGADDNVENAASPGETKSPEPLQHSRGDSRRSGIESIRRESNIDSIAAVSDIISMILAPMVIVPFLDYCALGKIPRSNTAKPGSTDGPTAKMGSQNSISQPLGDGWTVIFVSVRFLPQPTQMHTR